MNVFGTSGRATDFFQKKSYRPGQKEAIERIEKAFESDIRFVILEAPTGLGKSHIAAPFAFQSDDAFILTIQKILQDQYHSDFEKMFVMKGRSSYPCLAHPPDSCNFGLCKKKKETDENGRKIPISHPNCPYLLARSAAGKSKITLHNFDSFYYQNLFGVDFRDRKLLVVDECHNIEKKFLDFMSFTVSNRRDPFLEIPRFDSLEKYDDLIERYLGECQKIQGSLEEKKDYQELSNDEVRELDRLLRLIIKIDKYFKTRKLEPPIEYIFDYKDHSDFQTVTLKPLFVGNFVKEHLFPKGKYTLMMSATILSKSIFCKSIGLDPEKTEFIQVPSYFPPENRPILKRYVGSMTQRFIGETLKKIPPAIEGILKEHSRKKGIIQTHTKRIAGYIKTHSKNFRFTFNKDYPDPQKMLEKHKTKNQSVIVASGLREGLDLRGKLSEIQIFCKVPYPDLGDKRVQRKAQLDPRWYGYSTALMFVQSLGRSVRSETEIAITYLLDSNFDSFLRRNEKFIPGYIKKALINSHNDQRSLQYKIRETVRSMEHAQLDEKNKIVKGGSKCSAPDAKS